MATSTDHEPSSQPFVTRRSTIGVALIFLAAYLGLQLLSTISVSATGWLGALAALVLATADVTLLVSWVAGMVLAWRSRSVIWLLVACVPPPFGALGCALFAPAPPSGQSPSGGGPRGFGGPGGGRR